MKRAFLLGLPALLAPLALAPGARAEPERPIVVEYVAPAAPECASTDVFKALVESELPRFATAERAWRWSVVIRAREGAYEGTLKSDDGARTVTAARCDDVTAALAAIVARGEPLATLPAPAPVALPMPAWVEPDRTPPRKPSRAEWRLGARALASNHALGGMVGGMGVLSLELPWGFDKMMFEIAAGEMSALDPANPLAYLVVDTQACLVDVALGDTGLRALGCLRVAGASFKAGYASYDGYSFPQNGGALWTGAGARLRWQTPVRFFLEAAFDGVYGTVSSGESTEPGWFDAAISAGFRL